MRGGREKVSIKCVFFCFPKLTTTTNVSQALRAVPSKVPADNGIKRSTHTRLISHYKAGNVSLHLVSQQNDSFSSSSGLPPPSSQADLPFCWVTGGAQGPCRLHFKQAEKNIKTLSID